MRRIHWIGMAILLAINLPASAFSTVDEQIDHYLNIYENGSYDSKVEMLKRLQWSGLSDRRLFDPMERYLGFQAMMSDKHLNKPERALLAHMIRALGYSGNERYRNILSNIKDHSKSKKLKGHAKKALIQLEKFKRWNELIAASDFMIEGKSVEVATYMKMLSTNDVMVQRLAARAIFHERHRDPDLLAMTAKKLETWYLRMGLGAEAQDTVAWLVKAVGENNSGEYDQLLQRIYQGTHYKKVKKHAKKYAY